MSSRRQLIVDDLVAALESMSEGAGYNFDWAEWWKWKQVEFSSHPSGMVIELRETVRDLVYPKLERVLSISCEAEHFIPTDYYDKPTDTARMMIEDIERAVLADPTRGANAVDTRPTGNEMVIGDESVFVMVDLEVVYHTNRQDPGANV